MPSVTDCVDTNVLTPSRRDFISSNHISLTGVVDADLFEDRYANFCSSGAINTPLLIDFRGAEFIELACLANCIAAMVKRKELNFQTFVGYPEKKAVIDFLSVWRFDNAIEEALGIPFGKILLKEDMNLYRGKQTAYTGIGGGLQALEFDPDWDGNMFSRRNFFEFITIKASTEPNIVPSGAFLSAPRSESKRWTGELIKEVLKSHLGSDSPSTDIARVIVFESLSNAVRHPRATLIQCASIFQSADLSGSSSNQSQEKAPKPPGTLRLCVWDDGDSIASTLTNAAQSGQPIRAPGFPPYMFERIHVKVRDFSGKDVDEVIVPQSEDPRLESPEWLYLLSSLFPGITRTLAHRVPNVDPFDDESKETYLTPGMGLYALTRTVLDQFQGTLFLRSGNCRLVLDIAHDAYRVQYKVRYKAKITLYPKDFVPFKGNLLTMVIPTKSRTVTSKMS